MAEPDQRLDEFFKAVRQGHVFSSGSESGEKDSLVVVSQTCDVVLWKRPTVIVAKVAVLGGNDQKQAASKAIPRYVPLPVLGEGFFADLCFVQSRKKADLFGLDYRPGIDLDDESIKRDFSLSISRWFGRFAFPDQVVPWLRPLEGVVRERYQRQSALGTFLRDVVVEIRVEEANQWSQPPFRLEIHTIVRAEALPTLPDENPMQAGAFIRTLRTAEDQVKKPVELADILAQTSDAQERHHVLHAIAESLAMLCTPTGPGSTDPATTGAVSTVEWQLWGDDEFPLSRVRKSEPLDLEYLSDPEQRT